MAQGQEPHIPVGYVRKAHGIRGDVVVRGLVADIGEKLAVGASVFTNAEPPAILAIAAVSPLKDDYRVRFDGVDDRNAAEALRGTQLTLPASQRRTLADDEWWPEDLVGCEVVNMEGAKVGVVREVILATAQDRLVVVASDGARAEIPFVDPLVPSVDLSQDRIVVDLPDGLFVPPA